MKLLGWIGLVILIAGIVAIAMPEHLHTPAWLNIVLLIAGLVMVFTGRK
jgi:hypothetical protein